jgi:hypothetical protein
MNSTIFVGIGILLLVLLWLGRRRRLESAGASGIPDDSEYLVQLPPRALFARCLSDEDQVFVESLKSVEVSQLLVRERRRLALEWLRRTRREAVRLFDLHTRVARHAPDLRPASELRLLLEFGSFLFVYGILIVSVRLYGPVRARTYLHSVRNLAEIFGGLGSRIAASVKPVPVSRLPLRG